MRKYKSMNQYLQFLTDRDQVIDRIMLRTWPKNNRTETLGIQIAKNLEFHVTSTYRSRSDGEQRNTSSAMSIQIRRTPTWKYELYTQHPTLFLIGVILLVPSTAIRSRTTSVPSWEDPSGIQRRHQCDQDEKRLKQRKFNAARNFSLGDVDTVFWTCRVRPLPVYEDLFLYKIQKPSIMKEERNI